MASTRPYSSPFRFLANFHPHISLKILIFAAALAFAGLSASSARAQFQQSLVFSSGGAVAVRNDQTGALTAVSGSPFPATTGSVVLDVNGRFVFSADRAANSIHMYAITDSTTGAYNEVTPGSPFASTITQQPVFIAVEPTGNFIAVVNFSGLLSGQSSGEASIETFQITTSPPALLPVAGSAMPLDSTPLGFAQPPGSAKFYLYLGPAFPATPGVTSGEELDSFTIDPQTGFLHAILNSPDNSTARSFASDPQGRFLVLGHGELEGILDVQGINGSFPSGNFVLPQNVFPTSLYVDSTGSFVYAQYDDGQPPPAVVHILSLNPATGVLTESPSSPLPGFTQVPSYFPDPTGAFQYGFDPQPNLVHAFSVDPLTGYFLEAAGSPFTITGIGGSLTFSSPPGQQGIGGPSIVVSATSLAFGSIQTGTSSSPQVVTLTSNGGQALSINSISLSGADASQFTESDTCHAPTVIQPNNFCTVSIVFAPSATGPLQAVLTFTDNAPNSPQSVSLSGTGVAPPPPTPAVSINPNPLTLPSITQGTTGNPATIVVTNSGTAALHISSAAVGGNNPSDFITSASACVATLNAKATCNITVTFTPLAAGQRSETITLTDDASDSPQIINIGGTAIPAQPTTPIAVLSAGSLGFGTITQGTSSAAQTITVTNAGGAPLHISSAVLSGASPADYVLTDGCTASSYAVNSSCSLSVSFAPLSTGSRAGTIILTDDAPNSPQNIPLTGSASPAISAGPAQNGSTSATVSAGQTAQYNLQLTPGSGYSGTVSLTCSGAPLGAACQLPTTLQVSNGNAAPFTVSVATTGGTAAAAPSIRLLPSSPFAALRATAALYTVVILILLLVRNKLRTSWPRTKRIPLAFSASAFAILALTSLAGCGGGSSSVTPTSPPPIVTPQGTSTITITPGATSLGGKPLQLAPMQLTLTVN